MHYDNSHKPSITSEGLALLRNQEVLKKSNLDDQQFFVEFEPMDCTLTECNKVHFGIKACWNGTGLTMRESRDITELSEGRVPMVLERVNRFEKSIKTLKQMAFKCLLSR